MKTEMVRKSIPVFMRICCQYILFEDANFIESFFKFLFAYLKREEITSTNRLKQ